MSDKCLLSSGKTVFKKMYEANMNNTQLKISKGFTPLYSKVIENEAMFSKQYLIQNRNSLLF